MVLCADIGTSSLKLAAINDSGTVLSYKRVAFDAYTSPFVSFRWIFALRKALWSLAQGGGLRNKAIEALCISGNGPTLVSSSGETLLWNQEIPFSAEMCSEAKQSLFIPRIVAFKTMFPQAFLDSPYMFSGPEFLLFFLTGHALTILPEERYVHAYWTQEALEKSGFTKNEACKLPPFVPPASFAGTVRTKKDLLAAFPFLAGGEENDIFERLAGVPVFCGAPDFIAALVGTATLVPGALCDRAGSSEGINLCTTFPIQKDGVRTLPSLIPGLWNASVLFTETGSRFAAFRKTVSEAWGRDVSFEEVTALCLHEDGTSPLLKEGRLLMERTAREVKAGLDVLREAVTDYGAALIGNEAFGSRGLTTTGGQAANIPWISYKASVLDIQMYTPACPDAELIGDAIFAYTGLGRFSHITEAADRLCQRAPVPKVSCAR